MIDISLLKSQANELGVSLDGQAAERFELLARMLVDWNSRINLTAITEPEDIVVKHFTDSLSPLAHISLKEGAKAADVGCGAGFPGLPIIIARPDVKMTFIDSVGKKLNFTESFLEKAGLFGETLHMRAEDAGVDPLYRESFDAVFTRAVAPLNVLAEYCLPLLSLGGIYVSMKGADDEAAAGAGAVEILGGEIEKTVSLKLPNGDGRSFLIIRKVSHTPTNYPRKSKKIAARPL